MILADSSIWIEMFRRGGFKAELGVLIANNRLCTHPFVIAELACGYIPDRQKTLLDLDRLKSLQTVPAIDVRYLIEMRSLSSKGIGFVDAQLIASCLATPGTGIWTIDGPFGRVCEALGIRAHP